MHASFVSKPVVFHAVVALLAATLAGCGRSQEAAESQTDHANGKAPVAAVAELLSKSDSNVRGSVRFVQDVAGVRVLANLTGLTPGEHGIHVHESGDCSAYDASSAGGHFNPTDAPHADRGAESRHVGDLGNLVAGADGVARLNYVDTKVALHGPNSIIGRSVVVHASRDDGSSQPSGNSGARIACGEIVVE